jgi:hypothetical protein
VLHSLIVDTLRLHDRGDAAAVAAAQQRLKAALVGDAAAAAAVAPVVEAPAPAPAPAPALPSWGSTFGLGTSAGASSSGDCAVSEVPTSSPLSPWYLSGSWPSFRRTSAGGDAAAAAAAAAASGATAAPAAPAAATAAADDAAAALLAQLPASARAGEPLVVVALDMLRAEQAQSRELSRSLLAALQR